MENPSYKAPKDFTSFDVEKFINDNYGWLIKWFDNPINYFTSEEYKLTNDKRDPYGFTEFICKGSVFRWQEHIKEILKSLVFSKFCKIKPSFIHPQKMYCLSGFIEQTGRLPVKTDEVKLYYWGEDDKGVRFLQRITEGIITQYLTDIRIATINGKPIDHKIGTQKMKQYKLLKDFNYERSGNTHKIDTVRKGEILTEDENFFADIYGKKIDGLFIPIVRKHIIEANPELFEEVKENKLELFKVSENIYSDGRAAGKTYKVELIGSGYENKKPDIDKVLKNIEPFCLFRNFMKLSDTEKEIIEDLRKAKEAGVSMNNFSMLRGAGGTIIQEGVNMFITGATITGGTV